MEDPIGKRYTAEAPMRIKKEIEAYTGPGELVYVDFAFKEPYPSEEVGDNLERIYMVFGQNLTEIFLRLIMNDLNKKYPQIILCLNFYRNSINYF